MKLRIKSFILATIITSTIGVQAFAISLSGNSTGSTFTDCYCGYPYVIHEIGVARSNSLITTYGYSWVGANNESLYTITYVGNTRKKATGYGWAQTSTFSAGSSNERVNEAHGKY